MKHGGEGREQHKTPIFLIYFFTTLAYKGILVTSYCHYASKTIFLYVIIYVWQEQIHKD
jgi:hypothetical protein